LGGAHRDPSATITAIGEAIASSLQGLGNLDHDAVKRHRREKFLAIGRSLG
jgi:acetyl-CoA carboxylase carboxyl transferase subunit alpha